MVFVASNATLKNAVTDWYNGYITASTPLDGGTYGAIGDWDVSAVTDMSYLFHSRTGFNDDISNWDVSNVTDMNNMFNSAQAFNQPIGSWDVSSVTTMTNMFYYAEVFNNGQITNEGTAPLNWDVSNVKDTSRMFSDARAFNQDISKWNVSNVTNMLGMFNEAFAFNQDISTKLVVAPAGSPNYNAWDVSNVTTMYYMFTSAEAFNQPIGNWDVSSVTDMEGMFNGATIFNQNIGVWKPPSGATFTDMFTAATAFHTAYSGSSGFDDTPTSAFFNKTAITNDNILTAVNAWISDSTTATGTYGRIVNWDTSAVTDMKNLFNGAQTFNEDIGNWDVSSVTDMNNMLSDTQAFNQSIGNWDVSSVSDMGYMFQGADAFNQPIGSWDVSKVTDMEYMFNEATAFNNGQTNNEGTAPLNWDVSSVTDMNSMFNNALAFNQPINTQEVTVNGSTYTAWDVSKVTDMNSMFSISGSFVAVFNQPIGNWDVSSVTSMNNMFYGLTAFNQPIPTQDVTVNGSPYTAWDVSSVSDMGSMFSYSGFNNGQTNNEGTAPLYWDVSSVSHMGNMFSNTAFNQPIGDWNVSNVRLMESMFWKASAFNQPINTQEVTVNGSTYTAWDVSSVSDMGSMFDGATAFNQPIGSWDVSSVTWMQYTFQNTLVFDQDITKWNVSKVTNMWGMFKTASAFNQNIGLWDVLSVTDLTDMFSSATAMHIRYTGATGFGDTPTIAFFNKTAITQANIQTAVNAWVNNSTTATSTYGHISNWDVSAVTDMSNLFWGANFNEDIGNWDTLNVTSMSKMFFEVQSFNQSIGNWDVSKVNDMNNMFNGAQAFNNGQTNNEGTAPLNWDVSSVTDMNNMFNSASAFNQPIGNWDVSSVTDMNNMFNNAQAFDQPINTQEVTVNGSTYTAWDVSSVSDMSYMFSQNGQSAAFNQSIGNWDVSSVTTMDSMFTGLTAFNQPIPTQEVTVNGSTYTAWDVSSVSDMTSMFQDSGFNNGQTNNEGTAPLYWDVSKVNSMISMFNAPVFNQPIGNWNTSSVYNMQYMFYGATAFNQSINTQEVTVNGSTYTAWDVSSVSDMGSMFDGATAFNQPIGSWDVSSVTWMQYTFQNTLVFDQDITKWNVSKVTNMWGMFKSAPAFNKNIGFWKPPSGANFTDMFTSATAMHTRYTGTTGFDDTPTIAFFNKTAITQANIQNAVNAWISDSTTATSTYGDISNWDTSAVTDMSNLFNGKTSFNDDIGNWDVSSVTDMNSMFLGCSLFNQDIGNWDTSAVTDMNSMFLGCSLFNQDIGNWDTGNVSDMAIMFNNAQAFNQPIGSWVVSKVTNMNAMFVNAPFNHPLANWERTGSTLGNVTDMSGMFNNAQAFNQPIGNWDVSNVTSMQIMFNEAEAFNNGQTNNEGTAPLNWDVSKVIEMSSMFEGASVFNQSIGSWDVSKVTYMQSMFSSAETFDVDISNWNVGNVIDMSFMFYNNPVFDQPINTQEVTVDSSTYTAWDVSNVTDMNNMFGAPNDGPNSVSVFNQPIGSWDVSKVNNMENMFYKASVFDQPIGNWDVGNVNYMKGLFYRASSFKQDISNWDVSNVSDMDYMFFNASVFDGDISGWNITKVTTMMAMFYGASVFNHPLANWERFDSTLGNVTTMQSMFYEASVFDQPIGNWNVSLVNDMSSMFSNSAFNQSINEWTVSNVTDFTHMFDTNNAFYQSIRVWAVDSIANTTNMFYHADGLQKYYEGTDLYTATPSPSGFFNLGYTPPEITITGDNPVTVQAKTTYNDAGATATDSTGNVITVTHTSNVNMNQITTAGQGYEVKYNATDSNGHSAIQRIRTVNVVDTERPKIKLVGDEIVNFVVNTPGGYVDEGATATDTYYGDITSEIKTTYSPSDIITTALGTYTVTYSLTDDSGNKAYDVTRTVNVIDTPPTITITGDSIVNLNLGDTYTDQGATATDMLDGTVKVTTYTGDVDTSKIGTYKVKYTATNSVELTTTVHRKVVVADKHIPVITLKGGGDLALGESPVQINVNSAYTDPGAKAHDYVDGDITSHIVTDPSGGNIDTSTTGIHKITFNVTDSNHLAAKEVTRTVNVVDTGPTIKLQGSSQVSVDMGVTYDDPDPAVIATDPGGATITITTDGLPVDTSVVGTHTISYTATNTSNLSATVYRKVTVTDPYFLDIKLNGSTPVNIEQHSKYLDAGVKATENGTTIPESDIQKIGLPIDTSVVGTHTVTYKVTDAHGNTSKAQRTVNVKDDPPVITLNGISPYEKTVQQGQPYHDNDATEGEGAIAGDSIDGDLTHYIKKNIGPPDYLDTSTPGTFTITYNVSDSAGLAAVEKKRIINVHDPNYPTITLLDSPDGRIKDTGTIEKGSVYVDPGAKAHDVYYDDATLTSKIVTDPSGGNIDTSTLGEHKITYNVSNPAGNAAVQRTRTITVVDGKPRIILAPKSLENVPYGGTYIEPGYKAYDFRNTEITSNVVTNVADLGYYSSR
jgi:surface protein